MLGVRIASVTQGGAEMTVRKWLPNRVRLVILTALGLEYQAVREHLISPRVWEHPRHTLFEVGGISGSSWQVALVETGVGNRCTAVVTDRAVDMFGPDAIFLVGVAGGLRPEIALGDVVVATRIYDYQAGLDTKGGFLVRPQSWDAPYDLEQRARHLARTDWWTDRLGDDHHDPSAVPAVHFRPIAAGAVVLNSRATALAEQLRRNFNDAAAVEMESAGAAYAAHLNRLRIMTVRGISDHADGRKHAADRRGSQQLAARHAAAFTIALICALSGTRSRSQRNEVLS
jgi:adenosylhomocysteine nucleosidase